jgi:hypothetical protein
VKKIRGKQADYVLAVKENQPILYGKINNLVLKLPREPVSGLLGMYPSHTIKEYFETIIECWGTRSIREVTTVTSRYFISNKDASAEAFGTDIRGH